MKKFLIGLLVVGVIVLGVGTIGVAYAKNDTTSPQEPFGTGGVFGRRSGGPGGKRGDGHLSAYFHAELAEGLGITVADFEARREAGETLQQIAEDLGIASEDLSDLIQTAREKAIEQALADGAITQEQYDRMQQQHQRRPKGNQTQFRPGGNSPRRYGPAGGQPGN